MVPLGAVHGLKYWYHVTSPDLLHWKNEGEGLSPDRDYDNRGAHSGSAISVGDKLYFFYTGNHLDENWVRTPWTCAAYLDEDGKLRKLPEPLFGPRSDYSEHQRDPKIVWNAEKQKYYILIGTMDHDTLTFTPDGSYDYLDWGFDFYAAQGAANVDDPDKAVLIGWIGLPDNHHPTAEEDWEGSMSLPRELRIRDGKLIQTPISGIETLRGAALTPNGTLPRACELEIGVPAGDFDLNLCTRSDGSGGLRLHYDENAGICTPDRSGMLLRFNENVYERLDVKLESPLRSLRVFLDHSSAELFFIDGERTFTTHLYPTERELNYTVKDGAKLRIWEMTRSVTDEFAV